jgi:hypothetical protein
MLTNISRKLPTGTLVAIAGGVAALSFAGAAQAASMITVTGTAMAGAWETTNPTITPGATTGLAGTPTGIFAGLDYMDVNGIQPLMLIGTPPAGSTTFEFTSPGLISAFANINLGAGVTVNITPTMAQGVFVSSGGMTTTVYSVVGTAFFDVLSGSDYPGVFSLTVTSAGTDWVYTLSFDKSSIPAVPEPSAILGILAVVGAGAFARRKS